MYDTSTSTQKTPDEEPELTGANKALRRKRRAIHEELIGANKALKKREKKAKEQEITKRTQKELESSVILVNSSNKTVISSRISTSLVRFNFINNKSHNKVKADIRISILPMSSSKRLLNTTSAFCLFWIPGSAVSSSAFERR